MTIYFPLVSSSRNLPLPWNFSFELESGTKIALKSNDRLFPRLEESDRIRDVGERIAMIQRAAEFDIWALQDVQDEIPVKSFENKHGSQTKKVWEFKEYYRRPRYLLIGTEIDFIQLTNLFLPTALLAHSSLVGLCKVHLDYLL